MVGDDDAAAVAAHRRVALLLPDAPELPSLHRDGGLGGSERNIEQRDRHVQRGLSTGSPNGRADAVWAEALLR
eukprot:6756520-Pyramimonas_sp.AAC.1